VETKEAPSRARQLKQWLEEKPDRAIMIVGAGAVGCTLVFGGPLATTATIAALLACASGVILISKLPERLEDLGPWVPFWAASINPRAWILRHQILIDVAVSVGVFLMFPGVTGVLAAGVTGILVSCTLRWMSTWQRHNSMQKGTLS